MKNSLALKPDEYFERVPPVALSSSRIWLARGSFTPEGEIRIRNISGRPVKDLTLKVVFYDHSSKRAGGSVTLPVATLIPRRLKLVPPALFISLARLSLSPNTGWQSSFIGAAAYLRNIPS